MTPEKQDAFLDDLSLLVDGDTEALARWADVLADDDEARDLLHEARRVAERLGDAGAEFALPSDLESRVFGSLQERHAPTPEDDAGEPRSESRVEKNESGVRRGRLLLAAAAALALVSGGVRYLTLDRPDEPAESRAASLSARVDAIASGTFAVGLTVIAGEETRPLVVGESVTGARLRTDARTRARLALDDGSTAVVQQGSELALGEGRVVELHRGETLFDVATVDGAPAFEVRTPAGRVEVLGTKLLVTVDDDGGAVRVLRGAVRIHVPRGESVVVGAGQEAVLRDSTAHVANATGLAGAIAWSELEVAPEDDLPAAGLGELRAHKPGEREAKERPLTLAEHRVQVRIVGNVARTEIEEVFRNESGDTLEGVYRFPLPPDARIASLSLEVDGKWEEGAFVAKDRAAAIWRGVIRNATPETERRDREEWIWVPGPWRDPALLEWQQGGRFELRIFPIAARSERRVRIAYEQTLEPHASGRRYVYPLAHARDDSTRVGRFEVDVRIAGDAQVTARGYDLVGQRDEGAERLRYVRESFSPSGDLVLDYQSPMDRGELRHWSFVGDAVAPPPERTRETDAVLSEHRAIAADGRPYALFALRPTLPGAVELRPRDYVIVVDTSQSMFGERHQRAARLVRGMVAEMDRRDRVTALACDALGCRSLTSDLRMPGPLTAREIAEHLERIEPAGASDLTFALREALTHAEHVGAGAGREVQILYVGDGIATVGPRRPSSLASEASAILNGRARLTTVGIGQEADAVSLAALARVGGGQYVPFVPGQSTAQAALAVLEATYGTRLEDVELTFPEGVVDVVPRELPSVRAGQELTIAARLVREDVRGEVVLRGTVAGEAFEQRYPVELVASRSAGNAFVPRQWAAKSIEALELTGRGEDVPRLVALSKAYGVMSRHTSLLVLESEAMFRAFGVDRARPTVQWTGEEPMEYGESEGSVAVASRDQLESLGYTAAPAAASAPSMARKASSAAPKIDAMEGVGAFADSARSMSPPPMPPPRGGQWMRKVWYRDGTIARAGAVREKDVNAVAKADQRLREAPDSRDRHRELVRALSRAGELVRAEQVARDWLARDRMDAEALTYLSDVVGRQGRRDEALRLLSGVVDLSPDEVRLQDRMASAFERAGDAMRACAHRVAAAESKPDDVDSVAAAVRCERGLGREAAAERLLAQVPAESRAKMASAASRAPTPTPIRGEILLEGSWSGPDVDLTLVTPEGTRLSWMGGRTTVVGDDAMRRGAERLALRRATPGSYYVEVSRAADDRSTARGQVVMTAFGKRQVVPFELAGDRAMLARIDVERRFRLEPGRP
jgi:ferric-dicitrate binding protein FerR (iron transport regulator)